MDILLILATFCNPSFFFVADLADFVSTSWCSSRALFGRPSLFFFFLRISYKYFALCVCDSLRACLEIEVHDAQNCISTFVYRKWHWLSYTSLGIPLRYCSSLYECEFVSFSEDMCFSTDIIPRRISQLIQFLAFLSRMFLLNWKCSFHKVEKKRYAISV